MIMALEFCYGVNTVIFARLIFTLGSSKTYLQVLNSAPSRCSLVMLLYCTKLTSFNDTFTSNWAAQNIVRPYNTCTLKYIYIQSSLHMANTQFPMRSNVHNYKLLQKDKIMSQWMTWSVEISTCISLVDLQVSSSGGSMYVFSWE